MPPTHPSKKQYSLILTNLSGICLPSFLWCTRQEIKYALLCKNACYQFKQDHNKHKSPKVVVQRREVQSTTNPDLEGLTRIFLVMLPPFSSSNLKLLIGVVLYLLLNNIKARLDLLSTIMKFLISTIEFNKSELHIFN